MILSQVHVTAAVLAEGYRYCKSHEWASLDGNIATIGISNYAQVCVGVCVLLSYAWYMIRVWVSLITGTQHTHTSCHVTTHARTHTC